MKFVYTKLGLTDDYEYESEEEQQTRKKPDKKEPPKNPTSIDVKEFKWMVKEETGMNTELLKIFQLSHDNCNAKRNNTNSKKKSNNFRAD